jgi:hypothetical protein
MSLTFDPLPAGEGMMASTSYAKVSIGRGDSAFGGYAKIY